jgi:predicted DNA-binding transcriptional regulator YafY
MGSVADTIKVLQLLRNRGRMQISELAKEIGCNERTIRRYKDELVSCGYDIRGFSGKTGGYQFFEDGLLKSEWVILRRRLKDHKRIYEKIDKKLMGL